MVCIFQVDGMPLSGFSNQEGVELLKRTGPSVNLKIVRYLRGLKFEELQEVHARHVCLVSSANGTVSS